MSCAELKLVITREGIPSDRSAASQGAGEDSGCSGDGSSGTLQLPTDPSKARPTQRTCVEGPSKDPALAILDWPEASAFPLLEDLHAAIPAPWVLATSVVATPVPSEHPTVIVAIDLGRKTPKWISTELQAEFRG